VCPHQSRAVLTNTRELCPTGLPEPRTAIYPTSVDHTVLICTSRRRLCSPLNPISLLRNSTANHRSFRFSWDGRLLFCSTSGFISATVACESRRHHPVFRIAGCSAIPAAGPHSSRRGPRSMPSSRLSQVMKAGEDVGGAEASPGMSFGATGYPWGSPRSVDPGGPFLIWRR
jgi:hypothetical protein